MQFESTIEHPLETVNSPDEPKACIPPRSPPTTPDDEKHPIESDDDEWLVIEEDDYIEPLDEDREIYIAHELFILSGHGHVCDDHFTAAASGAFQYFIDHPVDISSINGKNDRGRSCLYIAAKHGHLNIVQLLVEQGADINIQEDCFESTPLHAAAFYGHKVIVKYLMGMGANPCVKNKFDKTPEEEAQTDDVKEMIQYPKRLEGRVEIPWHNVTPFLIPNKKNALEEDFPVPSENTETILTRDGGMSIGDITRLAFVAHYYNDSIMFLLTKIFPTAAAFGTLLVAMRTGGFVYRYLTSKSVQKSPKQMVKLLESMESTKYAASALQPRLSDWNSTDWNKEIIHVYTIEGSLYTKLNADMNTHMMKSKCLPYGAELQKAVKSVAKSYTGTVYRAATLGEEYAECYRRRAGETIIWGSFSSTTKNLNTCNDPTFANRDTVYEIKITIREQGYDITPFSQFKREEEVLLLPNTAFCVDGLFEFSMSRKLREQYKCLNENFKYLVRLRTVFVEG